MPFNISPNFQEFKIPIGDYKIVLKTRRYTTEEFNAFLNSRQTVTENDVENREESAHIDFINELLVGISATDAEGKDEKVTYSDPQSGEEKDLSPEVPDWKSFIDPLFKLRAGIELLRGQGLLENRQLKN